MQFNQKKSPVPNKSNYQKHQYRYILEEIKSINICSICKKYTQKIHLILIKCGKCKSHFSLSPFERYHACKSC